MNIVIDLDEVLADLLDNFILFYNHHHPNSPVKRDDFFSYNFWEVLKCSRSETIDLVYQFHQDPLFHHIQPTPDSQISIQRLKSAGHHLFIVTSRQNEVIDETKIWVDKYFPDMFDSIFFCNHFSRNGQPVPKSTFCQQIKADIIIDDLPQYIEECAAVVPQCFIFLKLWNHDYQSTSSNIQKVKSWPEIVKSISAV